MTLRNHDLMLQICAVLDDRAGIRAKGKLNSDDIKELEKNSEELKRLGKLLDLESKDESPKFKTLKSGERAAYEHIEKAMSFGLSNNEISNKMHVGHNRVRNIRIGFDLYQNRCKDTLYEIYRGENMVCKGTADECSVEMNVSPGYICWLTSPAARSQIEHNRHPEKCLIGFCREDVIEASAQ